MESLVFCVLLMLGAARAQASSPKRAQTDAPFTVGVAVASQEESKASLPQAPSPQISKDASPAPGQNQLPHAGPSPTTPPGATTLTITQAEQLALKNNPQISVARLTALASQQATREARSALWPQANADLTGVDSHPTSRITAGGLNNPIIYERAAVGATVTQLITDFGHTTNLVSSANLAAKAENQNEVATEDQIRLAADQAFYNALQAHAITRVAEQTVSARQTVADQIQALFNSKLKSQLDLSFANVNLSQAKLLLLDAQNRENSALAALYEVLGFRTLENFRLLEDTTPLEPPPANLDDLLTQSFTKRPELAALHFEYESARKFQTAERDLLLPAIRAAGAVGDTPVRNPALTNWYGAVGVNIDIPIFNGFQYSARAREAELRAQAANERLRDLTNRIARDVRTSWLDANSAYSALAVTAQLVAQANLSLDLAQTRYQLGLGSIVELSQAQLDETQAEIRNAQAAYDYRLRLAVLRYQTAGF